MTVHLCIIMAKMFHSGRRAQCLMTCGCVMSMVSQIAAARNGAGYSRRKSCYVSEAFRLADYSKRPTNLDPQFRPISTMVRQYCKL